MFSSKIKNIQRGVKMKTNTMIAMLNVISDRIDNANTAIVNNFPNKQTSQETVLNDLDIVLDIIFQIKEEMEKRQLEEDYIATGDGYKSFADFCAEHLKKA